MERISAESIGRRVAGYRREIGMTAAELARELGPDVTGNAITKLERGHRAQISPDLVVDIARALGVSPLALLFPLDEPDSEIVVGGMRVPVRSLGQWLLGGDVTTATFRQLVAADAAVRAAEVAEDSASGEEKLAARDRLNGERSLRALLENELRTHRERRSARDSGRSAEPQVIARVDFSTPLPTVTTERMPAVEVPSSVNLAEHEVVDGVDQAAP